MKVLVTGGAGFIGSHIVDLLIDREFEVVIIDNLATGLLSNINSKAKFIELDIRDKVKVLDIFNREKFDYVIHQAAQTMVHHSLENPIYDGDVNILGTINILECCRITNVKRIVFASTAAVYGDTQSLPVLELIDKNPASFYGLSKLTCEKYLDMYHRLFGLEYIVLRYANVYGERQGDSGEGGVISIFVKKIVDGEAITVFGDGTQTRDFIYVGDIANANYKSLFTKKSNAVYNISTQSETSLHALIAELEDVSLQKIKKFFLPPREGDIYKSYLSNYGAKENLLWHPEVSLREGLSRTYKFLAKNQ